MQCWDEDEDEYKSYCPTNDKIFELTYISLKDKFKREEILQNSIKEAINKESNGYNYFCTWDEYINFYSERIKQESIKIYATKILKLYLNDYVVERLYRFPDGLRLSELESRFKALQ